MKLRITTLARLIFAAALCSCSAKPDDETLRLYANAKSLYAQGRFEETAEMLIHTGRFLPGLVLRSKALYFSGDLEKAENSCRRALKLKPESFEAKIFLARVLHDTGDADGARQLADSLLADNPQDIRALRLAASLAQEREDFLAAAALLDQAAESSAEGAMALLDRARLRWVAGRGDAALEDLARARAMLPWDTPLVKSIEHLETRIKEAL